MLGRELACGQLKVWVGLTTVTYSMFCYMLGAY